jgi:AbiV family abortive infection protein
MRYAQACQLCIDNAEQYLKDAKVLKDIESYGHSLALATLGIEELSKAHLYHLVSQDVIQHTDSWIRGLRARNRGTRPLHRGVTDHTFKVLFQLAASAANLRTKYPILKRKLVEFKEALDQLAQRKRQGEDISREYAALVEKYNEELSKHSQLIQDVEQILMTYFKLHHQKMRGFYIDIERDEIHSPTDITLEDIEALINELKARIVSCRKNCGSWSSEKREAFKEFLDDWRPMVEQALKKILPKLRKFRWEA